MKTTILALLMTLVLAGTANALTLDFEDRPPGMIGNYHDLHFTNARIMVDTAGNQAIETRSVGWQNIFAYTEDYFTINDFSVMSFAEELDLIIYAYRDNVLAGYTEQSINSGSYALIDLDWLDIDTLCIGAVSAGQITQFYIDNLRYNESTGGTAPVPEPATILLTGLGLAGIGLVQRKRMAKKVNK